MRSYRYGNEYIKLIDSDHYFESYSIFINRILCDPHTIVRIAVLSDNLDVALGFSVMRMATLDYVHVHKDCRKQGIAKMLVPFSISTFTHLTKIAAKLWSTKAPNAKLKPFV
jgi:GNAT superfamily N-acetyltransferase